jgi:hypothetical protein
MHPGNITFSACNGYYVVMLSGDSIGIVMREDSIGWVGCIGGVRVTAARTRGQAAQLLADLHTGAYPRAEVESTAPPVVAVSESRQATLF